MEHFFMDATKQLIEHS